MAPPHIVDFFKQIFVAVTRHEGLLYLNYMKGNNHLQLSHFKLLGTLSLYVISLQHIKLIFSNHCNSCCISQLIQITSKHMHIIGNVFMLTVLLFRFLWNFKRKLKVS